MPLAGHRAIEALLAEDFRFSSPIDNALDRMSYLAMCWANGAAITDCDAIQAVDFGERAIADQCAEIARPQVQDMKIRVGEVELRKQCP